MTHPLRMLASVALTTVLLSGCSAPAPTAPEVAAAATPTVAAAPAPRPTAKVEVPVVAATPPPIGEQAAPVGVRIDAIGIDVPVIPVGVEPTGSMEIPDDPAVAGWYRYGPTPSSAEGNAVVAAHIDAVGYPIGPFAALHNVPAGAEVVVTTAPGDSIRYSVESVTYYAKTDLPTDALFARTGSPALVLITCGGEFDASTGHYRDNVVMVARPLA